MGCSECTLWDFKEIYLPVEDYEVFLGCKAVENDPTRPVKLCFGTQMKE
jgi:hypothetical protein